MRVSRITLSRIALALYLCLVAFLCFGKFPQSDSIPRSILGIPSDKVAHFFMFLPLVPLLVQSVLKESMSKWRIILIITISVIIGAGLAAATEYGQVLTGYRFSDIKDFTADAAGIVTGAIVAALLIIIKRSSR